MQGLRCFAFLGVFLSHTSLEVFQSLGHWGVSVFLVLSGFLMTYNYYGDNALKSNTIKDNLFFAVSKIKKIYPLHIITMLFTILLFSSEFTDISKLTASFILNILLIQEWFPIRDFSINLVAWYLCTAIFTYFLFPYVMKYMEKYNKRKACIMIFCALIVQCIIGFWGVELQTISAMKGLVVERNLCNWLVYYAPFSRFWDFFIGCNLAYIYMHEKHDLGKAKYTILEFLSIILVVISNVCDKGNDDIYMWYERVFIFSYSTVILVYVFAIGKGIISNLLTNKFTIYIAKISSFAYLIHSVVFGFMEIVFYFIFNRYGVDQIYKYSGGLKIILGFLLTVILCEIWIKMIKQLKKIYR